MTRGAVQRLHCFPSYKYSTYQLPSIRLFKMQHWKNLSAQLPAVDVTGFSKNLRNTVQATRYVDHSLPLRLICAVGSVPQAAYPWYIVLCRPASSLCLIVRILLTCLRCRKDCSASRPISPKDGPELIDRERLGNVGPDGITEWVMTNSNWIIADHLPFMTMILFVSVLTITPTFHPTLQTPSRIQSSRGSS